MSPRGAARWTSWSRSRTCAGGIRASGGRRSPGSVRKPRRPRGRSRRATSRRARSSRSTLRACSAGLGAGRDRAGARHLTNRADSPRVRGPVGGQPGPAGAPSVRTWGEDCGGPPCSIVPPLPRSPLAEKISRRRSRSLGAVADAPAREWSSVCRAGTAPVRLGDRTVGRDLGVMTYPPLVARRRGAGKRWPGGRGAVSGRQAEAAHDLEHAVARVRGPRPAAVRTDPPPRSEARPRRARSCAR
jgi:hypothetical protein